jgi:hypothetical protein
VPAPFGVPIAAVELDYSHAQIRVPSSALYNQFRAQHAVFRCLVIPRPLANSWQIVSNFFRQNLCTPHLTTRC